MSAVSESTKGYILESCVINSTRFLDPRGLNIVGSVTDIEIFENLDSPYLTGQIAIVDSFRLYDRLDFQGAEYLSITIKDSELPASIPIKKRFVIDSMITSRKANESSELIVLHFIEDTEFLSNLINVNSAHSGNALDIISTISNQHLDKDIEYVGEESVQLQKLKVIIPNMSPLQAMVWIKNRCATTYGLPYYLFSTLVGNKIVMTDMGTMLQATPINDIAPFIYGAGQDFNEIDNSRRKFIPIKAYNIENNDNLYNLISAGLVGANYVFYDTMKGDYVEHSFDVLNDALSQVAVKENERITFADDFKFEDIELQKYQSKRMAQITQSGAYDDGSNRYKSLDQEQEAGYSKRIASRALQGFLRKSPITITVNGRGFNQGDYHRTVGNIVRIIFLANKPNIEDVEIDLKKSGDYLIYASKHTMTVEKYEVHLQCVKITSYKDDSILRSIS